MTDPDTPFSHLAVVGAGAWGTALALVAARAGRSVRLLARRAERATAIAARRENEAYLPGIALDPAIAVTADMRAALADAEAVLLVVPSQHARATIVQLGTALRAGVPLVLCAKGVERDTLMLATEVAAELAPSSPRAVLSGPTFAREVALGLPTAVTLACAEANLGRRLVATLGGPSFRPYLSDDPIGAEIGGATKNVIAIACGIVAGRRLGDNARAALMTRGLAEIVRLAVALGGRRATLAGLSGLGDLTLTCNNPQSRNMALGIALGEGRTLAQALAAARGVVEGVDSALSIAALAAKHGVDMPIVAAVAAILHRGAAIAATMQALMARPFANEAG